MRIQFYVMIVLVASVSACANLNSIGRSTSIHMDGPGPDGGAKVAAKTIHLDAQQRVVIANNLGKICAEPSPDAMMAYASALAANASVPGTGAAAATISSNASAASIGLRTQSITLMRDALFRVCEAEMNGAIDGSQAAALLSRSQDLTAVILAVEQLTGAVAAKQAVLGGSASGDSTAAIAANAQTIEILEKQKTEAEGELTAAKQRLTEAKAQAKTRIAAANNVTEDKVTAAQVDGDPEVKSAAATVTGAEDRIKRLDEQIARVKDLQNAAFSNAAVQSAGGGSLAGGSSARSSAESEKVAQAVQAIVSQALSKSYAIDQCMAILTSSTFQDVETKVFCRKLVREVSVTQAAAAGQLSQEAVDKLFENPKTYKPADTGLCILRWRDEADATFAERSAQISLFISKGLAGTDFPSLFLESPDFEVNRTAFIADQAITCSKYVKEKG